MTVNSSYLAPTHPSHMNYITDGRWHRGLTYRTVVLSDGTWLSVWNEARKHGADNLARIRSATSTDKGVTWSDPIDVYDESGKDASDFCLAIMGDGRVGGIALRRVEAGTTYLPVFFYSDDNGATWSSSFLTGATAGFAAQFSMLPYPAAVGGHDTNGFIVFGYISGVRTKIVYQKTTDNGTNWTEGTAIEDTVTYTNVAEPVVERLGSENKWVMIVRDESSDGTNFLMAKSTDLTTWTGYYDSGQELGRNPPYLHYHDGDFHVYGVSRVWRDREIETHGDAIIYQRRDATDVWNDNGQNWPGWSKFVSAHRPLGYLNAVTDGEDIFLTAAIEEGGTGSTSDEGIRVGTRNTCRIALFSREHRARASWANDQGGTSEANLVPIDDERGTYIDFGSGLQICMVMKLTLSYTAATSLTGTWVFPKKFYGNAGHDGVLLAAVASLTGVPDQDWRDAQLRPRMDTATETQMDIQYLHNSPGTFAPGDSVTVSVICFGRSKEG